MKVRHLDREISYSLLLLHTVVITMITNYALPLVWAAFVAYALVMLAASGALIYLSYRYIESPFLRYKPK